MALSSVELLSVRCDRGEDRCKVVNVTLWEGREVREFALSQVASYDRGYSISSRRSRSQRYTTIYEQPVVVLEDGRKLALKRTERKVFMETNTFLDLKHYFGDRSQVDFKGRDVFAGIWFFAGVILCALLLLVGMLAIRYVRLEIDQEASELRLTRVGVFSPMRFKGGPGEVAMCVLQPDPQNESPGVYM